MHSDMKRTPPTLIPADAYEAFKQLAKKHGKSFGEALREAMREYAKEDGTVLNIEVPQHGGRREPSTPA